MNILYAYNRKVIRQLFIVVMFGFCLSLYAPVFTIKPGVKGGSLIAIIDGKYIMERKALINGKQSKLKVATSDLRWDEILSGIKGLLAESPNLKGHSTILIETKRDSKWADRFLVVRAPSEKKTMIFFMKVPITNGEETEWPEGLPKPHVDEVDTTIAFEDPDTTLASFSSFKDAGFCAQSYRNQLLNSGYQELGRNSGSYMSDDGKEFILATFAEEDMVTRGSIVKLRTGLLPQE